MHKALRYTAAAGVVGIILAGAGAALADPPPGFKDCRTDVQETQVGGNGLPTVYTDDLSTYVGVCGLDKGGYAQVDDVNKALTGDGPLVEGKTGNHDVDHLIGPGVTRVYVNGKNSGNDTCAPEGDDTYVGNGGNNISRDLPTVYTDGLSHHVGVCYGDAYVQLDDLGHALEGSGPLAEGQTGNEFVDSKVWGDGEHSYGPATVWLTGPGAPSPNESCAREGSDQYGHANGNNVTRELPTVYTDGGSNYVGICGGGEHPGRIEVRHLDPNDPASSIVVEGLPLP